MDIQSLLKEPWVSVKEQSALSLNDELKREINQYHPLACKLLNAIARSESCDDVLYQDKENHLYYLVHLTWAKEQSSQYPVFKIFFELEDFIKYCNETFQFNEDFE
ncbi:hypothetical protein [Aneurinibacillus uraniidurans]|uniref:hypothetical protein n=1 Tax=Aneurinibacillus uraniidurans TaxID=2966586 RepID=UPI00234C009E|nr:hypothetical protein [Aneurinibacillus sp. B1]WCN37019.1 hypothetical protein PO771_14310 [Aneurinibacillus sp. B1]